MKKQPLFTLAIILIATLYSSNKLSAQWSQSTTAIYPTTLTKNVGIGTSTPTKKLEINGGLRVVNEVSIGGGNVFEVDAPGVAGGRFKIAANGNVGIGTTNPTAKFEVNLLHSNWNGNKKAARFLAPDNNYYLDLNTYLIGNGNVGYQFSPNGNTGLSITTPGNVGIGTTNPTAKLHVNGGVLRLDRTNGVEFGEFGSSGTGNIPSKIWENSTGGYNKLIIQPSQTWMGEWNSPGSLEVDGYMNITSGSLGFGVQGTGEGISSNRYSGANQYGLDFCTSNWKPRMSIANNGYVGIGTQAPLFNLDLPNGIIRCGAVLQTSDGRYKTNIKTLNGALNTILALRGTSYDFNAQEQAKGFSSDRQVGFIAQEMQQVIPELVKEDAEGMLAVNYTGVIPILVEAFKEQHEVIEEKETRIAALEAQNTELQSRLARIEAALGIAAYRQPEQTAIVSAKISPNPTNSLLTISLTNTASAQSVIVKIMDDAGHEIANRSAAGESSIQFNLSQFPSGVYVAQVIADGKLVSSSKIQLMK